MDSFPKIAKERVDFERQRTFSRCHALRAARSHTLLDSDGNVDELIPVWLDGCITCIWPLEVAAGMDPVALRRRYGKSLGLIGAIDKRALAKDKKTIQEEVMSRVSF